jgi:hypothetical protein
MSIASPEVAAAALGVFFSKHIFEYSLTQSLSFVEKTKRNASWIPQTFYFISVSSSLSHKSAGRVS